MTFKSIIISIALLMLCQFVYAQKTNRDSLKQERKVHFFVEGKYYKHTISRYHKNLEFYTGIKIKKLRLSLGIKYLDTHTHFEYRRLTGDSTYVYIPYNPSNSHYEYEIEYASRTKSYWVVPIKVEYPLILDNLIFSSEFGPSFLFNASDLNFFYHNYEDPDRSLSFYPISHNHLNKIAYLWTNSLVFEMTFLEDKLGLSATVGYQKMYNVSSIKNDKFNDFVFGVGLRYYF